MLQAFRACKPIYRSQFSRAYAVRHFKVPPTFDGARIDKFLRSELNIPQSLVERFLRLKKITLTDTESLPQKWTKLPSSTRLETGQYLHCQLGTGFIEGEKKVPKDSARTKVDLPPETVSRVRSWVIHRDDDIIVINKPPGIPVQGSEDSIANLLSALTFGNEHLPHIVHRLDKHTSGILILARSPQVAQKLAEGFRSQKIFKMYWAITLGVPKQKKGTIRANLTSKQDPEHEGRVTVDEKDGSGIPSSTAYQLLETMGGDDAAQEKVSLLALRPHTGRTHQLRVHCASILETPIVGDFKYGSGYPSNLGSLFEPEYQTSDPKKKLDGLCLHAKEMCLYHPVTQVPLRIRATLPLHMAKLFNAFGWHKKPEQNKKAWLPDLTVLPIMDAKKPLKKPGPVTPKTTTTAKPAQKSKTKDSKAKAAKPAPKKGKLK